jgi:hypothetical protein
MRATWRGYRFDQATLATGAIAAAFLVMMRAVPLVVIQCKRPVVQLDGASMATVTANAKLTRLTAVSRSGTSCGCRDVRPCEQDSIGFATAVSVFWGRFYAGAVLLQQLASPPA